MFLTDVNVLVTAHRVEQPRSKEYLDWLLGMMNSDEAYGMSELVLSGFLRIVTNPRTFPDPTPTDVALRAVADVRDRSNCVPVNPGSRHWEIFVDLCQRTGARGNLVPDAYLAALAIEHGCEFVTADGDFARFPGLRWRHPLN